MVDKSGELNAYAAGGPNAAADYRAAQSGVSTQRAQALQDAGNRSGAAYAPAEFRAQQATRIGAPLDSAIQGLGAMGSAAGQYQGAQSAAQAGFISNLDGTKGLLSRQAEMQANSDYAGALNDVNTYLLKHQRAQDKLLADQEKQKKALDSRNKDYGDSQKEFVRQDAASSVGSGGENLGTFNIVDDVVSKAKDGPSAKAYFLTHYAVDPSTGSVLYKGGDKDGTPVEGADATQIDQYLTQAFQEQQPSAATFYPGDTVESAAPGQNFAHQGLVPGSPEYQQFLAQYGNAR